jgi:hypothetical protein
MPRRGEARRDVDPSETEPKSDCDTKKKSAFSVCASPQKKTRENRHVIGPRRFYRVQNASSNNNPRRDAAFSSDAQAR